MDGKAAEGGRECSMCGDIGFQTELFQCKGCNFRWQHNYCSRLYPSMGDVNWEEWPVCDWCFGTVPRPRSKRRNSSSSSSSTDLRRSSSSNFEQQAINQAKSKLEGKQQQQQEQEQVERARWDPLDYLLEVAQMSSLSDGETTSCIMKRQACRSKRTCARKLFANASSSSSSLIKRHEQKWGFVSDRMKIDSSKSKFSSPSSPKSLSPRQVSSRRYKLLSDV